MHRKNILVLLFLGMSIFASALMLTANARPISFFGDVKEKYQDYQGNWRLLTNENFVSYPVYLKSENSTHYIIDRMDDELIISKNISNTGSFNFQPFSINFTIEAPASNVAQISQANGTGQRRIRIPESIKQTYKRFSWDNKLPTIILKNQTWNMTVLQSDYWYSQDNGTWFNFKTVNVTGLASDVNATFIFSSWLVNNATTIGWTTSNISYVNLSWSGELSGSLAPQVTNTSGLVGYWSFGETSGTILHNTNNENGTINTTNQGTWYGNTTLNSTTGVTNRTGNALQFNGVNNYVDLGNESSLSSNQLTIVAWINGIYSPNQEKTIISRGYSTSTKDNNYWLYSYGGKLRFHVGNGTNSNGLDPASDTLIDNTWYHIVAVVDSTTILTYINSTLFATVARTITYNPFLNNKTTVGAAVQGTIDYFNGTIDEVQIWNRALSAQEIANNYNASFRTYGNLSIYQQNASSSGKVINAVQFNISNLNVQNNTATISAKQNGTSSWTQISTNYVTDTWINRTYWTSTDFLIEINGNGSSRAFVASGQIEEGSIPDTSVSSGSGSGPSIGVSTGGSSYVYTPPVFNPDSREDITRVQLDGHDVRIPITSNTKTPLPITALNLYFTQPYFGEYPFTITTFAKYPQPLLSTIVKQYFTISPRLDIKQGSSMELESTVPTIVYQLYENGWQKLPKPEKIGDNTYRVAISSFGVFAIVEEEYTESATQSTPTATEEKLIGRQAQGSVFNKTTVAIIIVTCVIILLIIMVKQRHKNAKH